MEEIIRRTESKTVCLQYVINGYIKVKTSVGYAGLYDKPNLYRKTGASGSNEWEVPVCIIY